RVWAAYADPRQLERFWGPPEWPATFVRHDFVVGGRSEYQMTGPNGDRSSGFFEPPWGRSTAFWPPRKVPFRRAERPTSNAGCQTPSEARPAANSLARGTWMPDEPSPSASAKVERALKVTIGGIQRHHHVA
ncbi:MAG: SRPBCC domain-containing protein, partial [Acidobacteria bacterium]|nr:SRPBCC domain-containing protein [Acidobacteriota bacterium]